METFTATAVKEGRFIPEPETDQLQSSYDVVVVGGGPAGYFSAYNLGQEGASVLLVDAKAGRGGSATQASLEQWRTFQSNPVIAHAVARSSEIYRGFDASSALPYLFVAHTPHERRVYARVMEGLRQDPVIGPRLGESGFLTPEQIAHDYPYIDGEYDSILRYDDAGHADLGRVLGRLIQATPEGTFTANTRATEIAVCRGQVQSVGLKLPNGGETRVNAGQVVLAPGPFSLTADHLVVGGQLRENGKFSDLVTVQYQKSFVAPVGTDKRFIGQTFANTPDGHVGFFIVNGGYVRMIKQGDHVMGHYGGASEDLTINPAVPAEAVYYTPANQSGRTSDFPAEVYDSLGRVISAYGEEDPAKTFAARPEGDIMRGYYTTMEDRLPVVSATPVEGLFILTGLMGEGVMLSPAMAEHLRGVMTGQISDKNNPYSLNRDFSQTSEAIVL